MSAAVHGRSLPHADSGASPLLSGSLHTVRDGIIGSWDGKPTAPCDVEALRMEHGHRYLRQIGMPAQAAILEAHLISAVGVGGGEGEPSLFIRSSVENADKPGAAKTPPTYVNEVITSLKRPSMQYFASDLQWVRAYADLRSDRIGEIHMQLDDLLSYFGTLSHLDNGRRKYTLMMLDSVRRFAIHIERQMKFLCRAPRPNEFAMQVQPIIQTPDHSSYPSGHAIESFAIATVLYRLSSGNGAQAGIDGNAFPFRLAHRIAVNRTVAGVHFPADSEAGAWVGCYIGELFHRFAMGGDLACGGMPEATYEFDEDGNICTGEGDFPMTKDFLLSRMSKLATDHTVTVPRIDVAAALWSQAQSEWPTTTHQGEG
jgi:membrane-associated phospholipid phosphatase